MKQVLSIIALLSILLIVQCVKEEEPVQYVNADQLTTESRNGNFANILSLEALTSYHQKDPVQTAYNKDSIINVTFEYKGQKTKALGLYNGTKIPAKLYDVDFLLADSTHIYDVVWIKDTVDNFVFIPYGINNANLKAKYITYLRSNTQMEYYDTNYNKIKNKYKYTVRYGLQVYTEFYNGSTENGSVFWLNHKF